jgi:hypothetical protein
MTVSCSRFQSGHPYSPSVAGHRLQGRWRPLVLLCDADRRAYACSSKEHDLRGACAAGTCTTLLYIAKCCRQFYVVLLLEKASAPVLCAGWVQDGCRQFAAPLPRLSSVARCTRRRACLLDWSSHRRAHHGHRQNVQGNAASLGHSRDAMTKRDADAQAAHGREQAQDAGCADAGDAKAHAARRRNVRARCGAA